MNLSDGLRINSWRFPDKDAVVFEDKRISYLELNRRTNQLAHGLLKRGYKRGDHISILMYNQTEFLEVYNALARIGIVSVPINFRLVDEEITYIINDSDSIALIVGDDLIERVNFEDLEDLGKENFIVVGDNAPEGTTKYEDIIKDMPENEPEVEQSEDDIFYIGYTSGTTSFPKGCLIKTRSTLEVVSNAIFRNAKRDMPMDLSQRVFLAIMPICHSNSIWATLITFWMGGKNVIFPSGKFDSEEVLSIVDKERVNATSLVPTMIHKILELPDETKNKYNIDSLMGVGSSSAPLRTTTKKEALKFFKNARFSEGYGATEIGAVTTLRHRDQERKEASIGKPNPGIEVQLRDEETGEVVSEPHKVGEMWVKTPAAFAGYYNKPEETKNAIDGDWVTAGDMAYFDDEGYYYLVDRKGDMIISGGENISPGEIEEVITQLPEVEDAAVIGIPNEAWGEEVKAVVQIKEGKELTEEKIINHCKQKLAGFKCPRSVDFVTEFPRTATGKILKRQVKEPYWKDEERMI